MKIWDKYKCSIPGGMSWNWNNIDQWIFEIITLTEKTCKLKQDEKPFFDYVDRFMKGEKARSKRIITLKSDWKMKDYIKEEFVKYDTWSWLPFSFELIK
jgi:hypothetical protein